MNMELLTDYYARLPRQGPGSREATLRALMLTGLCEAREHELYVADMGCGTGASTSVLAHALPHAHIVAVDFLEDFLLTLQKNMLHEGFEQRVRTLHADMSACAFEPAAFHMIWSEGAIYNMGFEAGIKAWRPFLKDNGFLVVSEISWLTPSRPKRLQDYWDAAYAEMGTVSAKMHQLEQHGYILKGYFPLDTVCWLDNYYTPQKHIAEDFLAHHKHSDDAKAMLAEQQEESALYERYQAFYGYGMYVAQKVSTSSHE